MRQRLTVFFFPIEVPKEAIQGWYEGPIAISNPTVFCVCVPLSIAKDFHYQSCLTAKDSCRNSNHHVCSLARKEKEGENGKWMYYPTESTLFYAVFPEANLMAFNYIPLTTSTSKGIWKLWEQKNTLPSRKGENKYLVGN